jgi:hypothetical protein
MRVGSSELFGSLGDAQGAARASWRAVLRPAHGPTRRTSGDHLQSGRGRNVISGKPMRPFPGEGPQRATNGQCSGEVTPVKEDPLRGDRAGNGFERTGICMN